MAREALEKRTENSIETYRLLLPLRRPVIKDKLCDVPRALTGAEKVLLGLPTHQDQP